MIMVAMSYFCRQNMSQISLEIVVNCSHPSEILALEIKKNHDLEFSSGHKPEIGLKGGRIGSKDWWKLSTIFK